MIRTNLKLLFFLSLFLATRAFATELTVHAASSLTDAVKEITAGYEKMSGDRIQCNFGASSLLVRQIQEGVPADLFLSADELKMDSLEKAGLLAPGTRRSLLSNTLVIVVPADSTLKIHSAADLVTNGKIRKIVISQPESVPVGIYSKKFLTRLGLWDKVSAKVVPTENARASLAVVESGNVEAGFVYKTDVLISRKVKVALEIPANEGPGISYPIAILAASENPEAARKLLAYFESEPALAVFHQYGFAVTK